MIRESCLLVIRKIAGIVGIEYMKIKFGLRLCQQTAHSPLVTSFVLKSQVVLGGVRH